MRILQEYNAPVVCKKCRLSEKLIGVCHCSEELKHLKCMRSGSCIISVVMPGCGHSQSEMSMEHKPLFVQIMTSPPTKHCSHIIIRDIIPPHPKCVVRRGRCQACNEKWSQSDLRFCQSAESKSHMSHPFGSLLGVIQTDDAYVSWLGPYCQTVATLKPQSL